MRKPDVDCSVYWISCQGFQLHLVTLTPRSSGITMYTMTFSEPVFTLCNHFILELLCGASLYTAPKKRKFTCCEVPGSPLSKKNASAHLCRRLPFTELLLSADCNLASLDSGLKLSSWHDRLQVYKSPGSGW